MSQKPIRIIYFLILLILGFVVYVWWNNGTTTPQQRPNNAQTSVKTASIQKGNMSREVKALGTAIAYDSAKIINATADYITQLNINEGQPVQQGQLLAQLNDTEEQARVNELKALLTEQKRQLSRLTNLTRTQASAISLQDEQQAKVNATQAQLDALQAKLQEMQIRAPFDGILGLRNVSQGAFIAAGTVLTTLDDIRKIRVEFNVPEHFVADLMLEMPLSITNVAYGQQVFAGQIKALDPRLDPITRSVKVHGLIDNPSLQLRPGMLLNVTVQLSQKSVLQVSEKALVPLQNKQFVYVVDSDNRVSMVEVTLGQRIPGWVEVLSGLKEGDEVVIEGTQKLRQGMQISKVGA